MVPTFNTSTQEIYASKSLEDEASLVYKVGSRTIRATQRNPIWTNQTKPTITTTKTNKPTNNPRKA